MKESDSLKDIIPWGKIEEQYVSGSPIKQLSREFGIPYNKIAYRCKTRDWTSKRQKRFQNIPEALTASQQRALSPKKPEAKKKSQKSEFPEAKSENLKSEILPPPNKNELTQNEISTIVKSKTLQMMDNNFKIDEKITACATKLNEDGEENDSALTILKEISIISGQLSQNLEGLHRILRLENDKSTFNLAGQLSINHNLGEDDD